MHPRLQSRPVPRLISDEDTGFIIAAATTRPAALGQPFTHWSLRKLAAYLAANATRVVRTGRERLRQILHARRISFQRTRTWKESADPDKDAKLDRIEHVTSRFPGRCFAFDQFGPLSIRPAHGSSWARQKKPVRLPARDPAKSFMWSEVARASAAGRGRGGGWRRRCWHGRPGAAG